MRTAAPSGAIHLAANNAHRTTTTTVAIGLIRAPLVRPAILRPAPAPALASRVGRAVAATSAARPRSPARWIRTASWTTHARRVVDPADPVVRVQAGRVLAVRGRVVLGLAVNAPGAVANRAVVARRVVRAEVLNNRMS